MSFSSFNNLAELARNGGFKLIEGQSVACDSIDWRFIASVDTPRIVKDSDFEKLDECISFIIKSSFGNLLSEVRILDPAIAKIYVISQLAIQYLLFCTKFLDKTVHSSRENIFNYQTKIVRTEEIIQNQDSKIARLKLKIHELKNRREYSCPKCTRVFEEPSQFETHMYRDHEQEQKEKEKDLNLINTIKLQLEVKNLKERLNIAERELMQASSKTCDKCLENSKRKFDNVAVQSNFEEKEKDDTEKEAIQEALNAQMIRFEDWKRSEETHYRGEIEALTAKFDKAINEIKENYEKKSKQKPQPAPRIRKFVQSEDSLLWKTRFEELEKMYQLEIGKHVVTMKSMEKAYQEKIREVQISTEKLKCESSVASKNLQRSPVLSPQERQPAVKPPSLTPPSTQVRRLDSPKVLITVHEESSSDDSEIEIVNEALKENAKKTQIIDKSPPIRKEKTFSAQKNDVNEWKIREKEKHVKNAQKIAERMFAQQAKTMGIQNPGRKSLSSTEFEKVQSNLVGQRDKVRKKYKNFFITRQKIQSKVDNIFNSMKSTKKDKSPEKQKNSKTNISSQVAQTSTPISNQQVKQSVVPADSNSTYLIENESNKIQFRDELDRMIHQRRNQEVETVKIKENQNPEINTQGPGKPQHSLQPQVIQTNNKKVLFDLENSPEVFKTSSKSNTIEINEEDSDFEISSFTSMEK